MDYGFKTTTHGRAVIAACGALETPLKLTRVEVGSGMVGEETNLADVHALLHYEAEAAITERRHEDDRLYLTVQYCNSEHPDVGTFYLSEFIVYAENPETGQETDLLYATLGDYRQGVPAYRPSLPASTWNFPMILVVSDEIEVSVAASPGLVTWDDLTAALERYNTALGALNQRHVIATRTRDPALPDYGLETGGGGEGTAAILEAGACTGQTEVAAIVSGAEYDAQNMSVHADTSSDGTLILRKLEE